MKIEATVKIRTNAQGKLIQKIWCYLKVFVGYLKVFLLYHKKI